MRSRIITLLAIAATTACSEYSDSSQISGLDGLSEVRKTTPIPAMAMSCLGSTREAVMQMFYNGTLTEEEVNPLLNRIDNVIRQIERDHQRPSSNVADSYNLEVQKYVESGRLTAEQASTIMMSFECIAPVAITAGDSHNCVLLSDKSVWCWGSNSNGQLGVGSTSNSSVPVRVANVSAAQIDAGGFNTCVVTPEGLPWCWGKNEWGQLGNASITTSTTPTPVTWTGDAVAQLSVGYALACGRTAAGEVYCWGGNSFGEAGSPATTDLCGSTFCAKTPIRVSTARTYKDVDVGMLGGCALDVDGLAYCWGRRSFGAIGDSVTSTTVRCTIMGVLRANCASEPTLVSGGHHFRSIQFGGQYVCAVRTDDQAMCWGANDYGQLGIGGFNPVASYYPLPVSGAQAFASLAAADVNSTMLHACGLNADGDASCWGSNTDGQIGAPSSNCTPNTECAPSPQAVTGLKFKQLGLGRFHTCGITSDNRVLCWGGNTTGQLGDGTTTAHAAPAPVVASWSDTP